MPSSPKWGHSPKWGQTLFRVFKMGSDPIVPNCFVCGLWMGLAVVSGLETQGRRVVQGVVVDTAEQPIGGATIELRGAEAVSSDDSGRFRLIVPHGDRVTFDIRRVGFLPSRFGLQAVGDTSITVVMLPSVQALPKVEVKARETDRTLDVTGFNERLLEAKQGTNAGIFITPADIERRLATRVTQMFDAMPGVICVHAGSGCMLVGNHLVPSGARDNHFVNCNITFYLDGQRLNSLRSTNSEVDIDTMVLPQDIAGIEYYRSGSRIPPKFSLLNGSCGLVLLWTKRGG